MLQSLINTEPYSGNGKDSCKCLGIKDIYFILIRDKIQHTHALMRNKNMDICNLLKSEMMCILSAIGFKEAWVT